MPFCPTFVLFLLLLPHVDGAANKCKFQLMDCWPTSAQITAFESQLEPGAVRKLVWDNGLDSEGVPHPRVSAVNIHSPNDQPLNGFGLNPLKALYQRVPSDASSECFAPQPPLGAIFSNDYCLTTIRNDPAHGWTPAFVVWAMSPRHIQSAVRFATLHNLCISVAGTGHDYNNRHTSCQDGLLIRTSLMKTIEWDLGDERKLGHSEGNVRLGVGLTFSEILKSASDNNRLIASPWSSTVGVVGWSLGGGHGPHTASLGLGSDNILEIDIVTADGNLITCNNVTNSDLFFAVRGGGGSNWGVVTSITVKAHAIPAGGITKVEALFPVIDLCSYGQGKLESFLDLYIPWSQTLDRRASGRVVITTISHPQELEPFACASGHKIHFEYVWQGPSTDPDLSRTFQSIIDSNPSLFTTTTYATPYEMTASEPLDYINPLNTRVTKSDVVNGRPSVLVSRDKVADGSFKTVLLHNIKECKRDNKCYSHEIYQDLTGNIHSPQMNGTAISSGLRTALLHYVAVSGGQITTDDVLLMYAIGDFSYFSESAFDLDPTAARNRYWGATNYGKLVQTKNLYDQSRVFTCHNCVEASVDDPSTFVPWEQFVYPTGIVVLVVLLAMLVIIAGIVIGIIYYNHKYNTTYCHRVGSGCVWCCLYLRRKIHQCPACTRCCSDRSRELSREPITKSINTGNGNGDGSSFHKMRDSIEEGMKNMSSGPADSNRMRQSSSTSSIGSTSSVGLYIGED